MHRLLSAIKIVFEKQNGSMFGPYSDKLEHSDLREYKPFYLAKSNNTHTDINVQG